MSFLSERFPLVHKAFVLLSSEAEAPTHAVPAPVETRPVRHRYDDDLLDDDTAFDFDDVVSGEFDAELIRAEAAPEKRVLLPQPAKPSIAMVIFFCINSRSLCVLV